MTKELMQLALDTLKENYELINGKNYQFGLVGAMDGYYCDAFDVESVNEKTEQTIKALKKALKERKDS